eukprot:3715153-Pleurochrysis_carterae.AAC.1
MFPNLQFGETARRGAIHMFMISLSGDVARGQSRLWRREREVRVAEPVHFAHVAALDEGGVYAHAVLWLCVLASRDRRKDRA